MGTSQGNCFHRRPLGSGYGSPALAEPTMSSLACTACNVPDVLSIVLLNLACAVTEIALPSSACSNLTACLTWQESGSIHQDSKALARLERL